MSTLPRGHAVYEGVVWHHRRAPEHRFRRRITMAWIDVERARDLPALSRWFAGGRAAPLAFRRSDHHGPAGIPLADAVRATVRDRLGIDAPGPVFALANLRTWGHCFNPIVVYWCTDAEGRPVAQLLEVTNTPWRERHTYVIDRRSLAAEGADERRAPVRFDKAMHVSPFLPMDCTYELVDDVPGARTDLVLRVRRDGEVVFDAGFVGRRRPLDAAAARRLALLQPTHRVLLGIHLQALRLWRKGATFHPHPGSRRTPERAEATS